MGKSLEADTIRNDRRPFFKKTPFLSHAFCENHMLMLFFLSILLQNQSTKGEDLLTHLRNAQTYHLGQCESGELHATLAISQTGVPPSHELIEVHAIWSGDKTWIHAELYGPTDHVIEKTFKSEHIEEWIILPNKVMTFHPNSGEVNIEARGRTELPLYARLSPKESWYGPLGMYPSWLNLLNPSKRTKSTQSPATLAARKKSTNLIEVVEHDSITNNETLVEFSLANDGNATAYRMKSYTGKFEANGADTWKRNASDDIVLSSRHIEFIQDVNGEKITVSRNLVLSDVQLKQVDPRRFQIESFNMPRGTMVRDSINQKVRRIGDLASEEARLKFNELIDLLQSRGFGKKSE